MSALRFDIWQKEREDAQVLDSGIRVSMGNSFMIGGEERFYLRMWLPKGFNPYVNYSFKAKEAMERFFWEKLAQFKGYQKLKSARATARKGTADDFQKVKVGSIFQFTWGYDQTNQDFFEVVKYQPPFVWIREIGTARVERETGNNMAMYVRPVQGGFLADGPEQKKKVQFSSGKPYLTMASYGWCSLYDNDDAYVSWYA